MGRRNEPKEWYGPLELDFAGRDLLQSFAQCVYNNWHTGKEIPKKLTGEPYDSWKSRLWWKLNRMYDEGALGFTFELFDEVSDKPPPDLSRLANKFSKEV